MRKWLGAGIAMAIALGAHAEDQKKARLLVVTGSHDFDKRFFSMFEGLAGVEWETKSQKTDPCAVFEKGFADSYDVVLLYDFESKISEEQKTAFEQAFGTGRGLIVLHHALCDHPSWPKFREIAGGQFFFQAPEGGVKSEYTGNVQMKYEIADPNHPTTKGVNSFEVVEEPYKHVFMAAGATPLLTSPNVESDPVVAWTTRYKQSRVVTIVPGHGWTIFENPDYRRFLAQTIRWVSEKGE